MFYKQRACLTIRSQQGQMPARSNGESNPEKWSLMGKVFQIFVVYRQRQEAHRVFPLLHNCLHTFAAICARPSLIFINVFIRCSGRGTISSLTLTETSTTVLIIGQGIVYNILYRTNPASCFVCSEPVLPSTKFNLKSFREISFQLPRDLQPWRVSRNRIFSHYTT